MMGRIVLVVILSCVLSGICGFMIGRQYSDRGVIACNNGDYRIKNIDFYMDFGTKERVYRFFAEFCNPKSI